MCLLHHCQQSSQWASIRRRGDSVRSLLHRLHSWVEIDVDAAKAHLPSPVVQCLCARSRSTSGDTSCSRTFHCCRDECGIASNAVTVLKPGSVDSVALSTPNLLSHFHRKADSSQTLHPSGVSPLLHYPPNSPSSLVNNPCFIS
jgi:hypothetical protein